MLAGAYERTKDLTTELLGIIPLPNMRPEEMTAQLLEDSLVVSRPLLRAWFPAPISLPCPRDEAHHSRVLPGSICPLQGHLEKENRVLADLFREGEAANPEYSYAEQFGVERVQRLFDRNKEAVERVRASSANPGPLVGGWAASGA